MKIVETGGMFAEIVNNYKREKKRCETNMFILQNEINTWIKGGKLYYDMIEGVLWFFVKNAQYYIAYFYHPKEEKLKMVPQDLDVIVEIMGNQNRYNSGWETELLESGFEKYHNNFEYVVKKEDCNLEKSNFEKNNKFVEKMGCYHRCAKKEDYDALYQFWTSKLDKYAVYTMTDKEIEDMERYNRGHLILNNKNEILAAAYYLRTGNTANVLYNVSLQKGFGHVIRVFLLDYAFREGCDRIITWIYENNEYVALNKNPHRLSKGITVKTGKFVQQFLMRKAEC